MDKHEAHKLLNQEILSAAKNYYAELVQNRAALDKKAEGTISIAGIFLAAIFAFARELTGSASSIEKTLLSVIVVALVSVVILSLLCLWTRRSRTSPSASLVRNYISPVINADDTSPEEEYLYMSVSALNSLSNVWDDVSTEVLATVVRKGRLVKTAQFILLLSIVLVAFIVIIKIVIE